MTADESLIFITKTMERDAWRDVGDNSPDRMLINDACALAAQLLISRESIKRFGSYLPDAAEIIAQTDNLGILLERIGEAKMKDSLLHVQYISLLDFANGLLDGFFS